MGWLPFLLLERSPQRSLPFICKYIYVYYYDFVAVLIWCIISVFIKFYILLKEFSALTMDTVARPPCWLLTHRNSVQRCERNSRQLSVLNRSLWLLCWQGRPCVLTHLITDRRPLCFLHNSASQFCPFLSDQWAIMTANRNRALTGN